MLQDCLVASSPKPGFGGGTIRGTGDTNGSPFGVSVAFALLTSDSSSDELLDELSFRDFLLYRRRSREEDGQVLELPDEDCLVITASNCGIGGGGDNVWILVSLPE